MSPALLHHHASFTFAGGERTPIVSPALLHHHASFTFAGEERTPSSQEPASSQVLTGVQVPNPNTYGAVAGPENGGTGDDDSLTMPAKLKMLMAKVGDLTFMVGRTVLCAPPIV